MTQLVQPRLVNDPFSDPGVFIDFRFGSRAILFDLGDLGNLSTRELGRVSHAFVSHAHIDHFIGFDRLLRARVHRPDPLGLAGPAGLIDHVAAKLGGYDWNLLDATSPDFVITVTELSDAGSTRRASFRAREAFARTVEEAPVDGGRVILDDEAFSIESVALYHGIPSFAFAFQEKLHVNVWKEGLDRLGLPVGRWLNEAKALVRTGAPDDTPITAGGQSFSLGQLRETVLKSAPGQRIAYVTDAAWNEENVKRIVDIAHEADLLFIEATFLAEDEIAASRTRHLTAAQAGALARMAGAKRIVPFHFSSRYLTRELELRSEVDASFKSQAP